MNILYVMNSGNFGGMEQHVLDLSTGMQEKGHTVYVWCKDGQIVEEFKKKSINITTTSIKYDIDPFYIFKLKKFCKMNKIDVIHAHELKASSNAALAGFLAGVKVIICHIHTPISEWKIGSFKKRINVLIYSFIINNFATCEIALTPSRKKIKLKEGIKENKLVVLETGNAIKFEEFSLSSEEKKIYKTEILARYNLNENDFIWGFVGRISAEKGHYVLVHGFKKFLQSISEYEKKKNYLIISGGGPLENEIKKQISDFNLTSNIIVTGKFSENDKKKLYSSFNVFIHPSLAEGFGIALIEAMAVTVPVLASDLDVFKEVSKDSINYFKTGDADDLAAQMRKIYDHYEDAVKLSIRAMSVCRDTYSMEKFIDDYENFYIKLKS